MGELLIELNKYSTLINISLFGTIIGFLIHISRLSRTALQDKHSSDIAAKEVEIASLISENKFLINSAKDRSEQFTSKLDILQYQLEYFQKIADLSEDKRVEAIKHDYSEKIKKLEEQLEHKELTESEAQNRILELKEGANKILKLDTKMISKIMETLEYITPLF